MQKKLDKKNVGKALLIIYVLLSSIYIIYNFYTDIQLNFAQRYYLQGRGEVINELIEEAEKSNCTPIPVFNEEKQVQFIDIACIQPAIQQGQEEIIEESPPEQESVIENINE